MRCNFLAAIFLTAVLILCSCQRRELVDVGNTHYVRVYVDEHIKNVTEGFYNVDNARPNYKTPQILHVTLADPKTGEVRADRYLRNQGDDERGHYYDGYIICEPGVWNLLAWNFDAEETQISSTGNQFASKAYTDEIAYYLKGRLPSRYSKAGEITDEKIVYDPDHLFVASCGNVRIPYTSDIDTLRTPEGEWFRAESIVESWYIQIRVKGMQYVSSSVSLLTGMAAGKWLWNKEMDPSDVTLFFEMSKSGEASKSDDETVIYSTFSTFGKLPQAQNELELTFDFVMSYGTHSETFNVTDEFYTENALNHRWIILDKVIEIPAPSKGEGGGFAPGIDKWDDIHSDLII